MILLAAISISFLLVSFSIINRVAKKPIHDEVHHVPQAEEYLKGNFRHWSPMITTPPGLYLVTYIYQRLLSHSLMLMRSINLIFALLIIFMDPTRNFLVVLCPLMYPYNSLYYTDIGSLFFVLLSDQLFTQSHFMTSALVHFLFL